MQLPPVLEEPLHACSKLWHVRQGSACIWLPAANGRRLFAIDTDQFACTFALFYLQARACVNAGATAVVIDAEDLMEGAAWDGAAIGRLLDAVGMDRLLFEAPHSQVQFLLHDAISVQDFLQLRR